VVDWEECTVVAAEAEAVAEMVRGLLVELEVGPLVMAVAVAARAAAPAEGRASAYAEVAMAKARRIGLCR